MCSHDMGTTARGSQALNLLLAAQVVTKARNLTLQPVASEHFRAAVVPHLGITTSFK
jgi:hypothetical protein